MTDKNISSYVSYYMRNMVLGDTSLLYLTV